MTDRSTGKGLRAAVSEAYRNARDNGYFPDGTPVDMIANDMVDADAYIAAFATAEEWDHGAIELQKDIIEILKDMGL